MNCSENLKFHKDDFSEEILEDLIRQGYTGEELLKRFRSMRAKVRPAVERLIAEADEAAKHVSNHSCQQY